MSRGDELIQLLSRSRQTVDDESIGEAANDLLAEFLTGYPLQRLRVLLHSADPDAVKSGVFILSELGAGAAPLVDEVPRLLHHQVRWVRGFALDPALVATGPDDGEVIAQAVALVRDPDAGVRWKAMRTLARLSEDQRAAADQHLRDDELQPLLAWLGSADAAAITVRLVDDDELTRRFAGIAAARVNLTNGGDRALLELAATSPDEELASFAESELRIPVRRRHHR